MSSYVAPSVELCGILIPPKPIWKSQVHRLNIDPNLHPVDYDPIHLYSTINIIINFFNFVPQQKEKKVRLPCLDRFDNANCSDGSMNCSDVKKSESKWLNKERCRYNSGVALGGITGHPFSRCSMFGLCSSPPPPRKNSCSFYSLANVPVGP